MDDKRTVAVSFNPTSEGIKVEESFEAESEMSAEQQWQGWQNILNNFAKCVESKK